MLDAGICPDQTENPVGLIGIAGPNFLAVDEVMVAFVFCAGLQAGQVRA